MAINWTEIAHGFHLFKDGTAWCAVGPHFIDLAISPAGFGETQAAAVAALHSEVAKDRWWDNKVMPPVDRFKVHAHQPRGHARLGHVEKQTMTLRLVDDDK